MRHHTPSLTSAPMPAAAPVSLRAAPIEVRAAPIALRAAPIALRAAPVRKRLSVPVRRVMEASRGDRSFTVAALMVAAQSRARKEAVERPCAPGDGGVARRPLLYSRGSDGCGSDARGFTIVEVIMVLGIITLMLAVILVSMRPIRNAANRTESLASLRQMVAGYSAYSADHRQHLMPGFLSANDEAGVNWVEQLSVNAAMPTGKRFIGNNPPQAAYEALESYVWRLAPYLDHEWRTVMADYRSDPLMSALRAKETKGVAEWPSEDAVNALTEISQVPSFGLNSIFLGGDMRHGGATLLSKRPWLVNPNDSDKFIVNRDRVAALRFTEVRNPSRIIVFAPASEFDGSPCDMWPYRIEQNLQMGHAELRAPFILWEGDANPPRWSLPQWHVGMRDRVHAPQQIANFYADGGGVPVVRWGTTQYPVANLDGSTSVEDIRQVGLDMRRWAPQATGLEPPLTDAYFSPPPCQ